MIQKQLFSYQKISRDLFFAFCMIFAGFLFLELLVDTKIQILFPKSQIPLKSKVDQHKSLAYSAFFPREKVKTALIPCDLSKEIELLACPSRPDSEGVEKFFISLKSSQLKQEIDLESWVYLDSQKNGFCFSSSFFESSLLFNAFCKSFCC